MVEDCPAERIYSPARCRAACWLVCLAGLVCLAWPAEVGAGVGARPELEILRQNLERQERELLRAVHEEERLQVEVARLDRELASQRQQLTDLNQRLAELHRQQDERQQELGRLQAGQSQATEQVQRRLQAAYRTGEVGVLNVLFQAESLAELLALQDNFRFIWQHDRQLLAQYRQQLAAQQEAQQALAELEAELRKAQGAINREEKRLQAGRQERTELLRRTQHEKLLHQQARREISRVAEQLAAAGQPGRTEMPGQPEQPGPVVWPVEGEIVVRFGEEISGRLGELQRSRGLTLTTAAGAPVLAPAAGTVVHAGEMAGYGQMLIIEHEQQHFSLLAGLAAITPQPGETVQAGQQVGRLATHPATGRGRLYLERRQGVEPLDPLTWLP